MQSPILRACLVALVLIMIGCAAKKEVREAETAYEEGRWAEAYRLWSEVLAENPTDSQAKLKAERARLNAALFHLQRADHYFERLQFNESKFELNLALQYDPQNQEARRLVDAIRLEEQKAAEASKPKSRKALSNLPQLNPTTWEPQDLVFIDQSVREIYQSLGQAYGVNIVIDTKIRDDKVTLDLRNLNFLKALDTLMVINRHFFKVIDDNTLIILEDNKVNRDRYDNQIIRTFYLSNVTPNDLKNHLRVLLNIKEFAENERLNAITIKGTPQQIAMAEKMIASNDKAQAEVVIEIEVLEVSKNAMRRIGILPVDPRTGSSTYQVGVIADPVGRSDDDADAGGLRGFFPDLNSNDFLTIVPAIAVDFLKENGGSTQVANPQLRVTSGEQGTVRIGQSIPIVQTSFTNAQISGSSAGGNNFGDQALTTFNYNDVGINIDVTPRVHFNNEVTLNLTLEISSVVSGGLQPTLGQRQVTTSLRLRNGETNVIAGLLSNDERKSLTGIAGLADIPILGKLFSNDEKVINQTDIIMTMRPVIVRGPSILDEDRAGYELSNLTLSTLYADDLEAAREPAAAADADTARRPLPRTSAPAPGAGRPEPRPRRRAFDPQAREPQPQQASEEDYSGDPFAVEEVEALEAPAPTMLSFMPLSAEARQDEFLNYQLFVTNVEDWQQGEIVVTFDPSVVRVESVNVGDFFNGRNMPLFNTDWNNDTGRLAMLITQRSSGGPFSGSGIIASLRFRALQPGSGALQIPDIMLETTDGQTIPTEILPAGYEINP